MIVAQVIGAVVSTRKHGQMQGVKLLAVRECTAGGLLIAGDLLGAGIGEYVLVTRGKNAAAALDKPAPVDAMVVGIVDSKPSFLEAEDHFQKEGLI